MRLNKRASLEIGVNTIVILVIAMVLLGLGIAFIKGLFGKLTDLPEQIDTSGWNTPPTASEPIQLNPPSIELKSGDDKAVEVGVYNKESSMRNFTIDIKTCSKGEIPVVESVMQQIEGGQSGGFKVIITAKNKAADAEKGAEPKMTAGKHICELAAYVNDGSDSLKKAYGDQFILEITN